MAFPAKVPLWATRRVAKRVSETVKLPAERQYYQCIREAAFPAETPFFIIMVMFYSARFVSVGINMRESCAAVLGALQ
jgi:hypothetical protein